MKWQRIEYPPDGTWCWVSNGISVWIGVRDHSAAGGWANQDTWEDFGDSVVGWIPLEKPDLPTVVGRYDVSAAEDAAQQVFVLENIGRT